MFGHAILYLSLPVRHLPSLQDFRLCESAEASAEELGPDKPGQGDWSFFRIVSSKKNMIRYVPIIIKSIFKEVQLKSERYYANRATGVMEKEAR
jgi:hypothetical protein